MAEETEESFLKENVLGIRGVDGYLCLDTEFELLEKEMPASINAANLTKAIRTMISDQRSLGNLETTILLTEKGVLHITRLPRHYLVIIAGYRESVDVSTLAIMINQLKPQLAG